MLGAYKLISIDLLNVSNNLKLNEKTALKKKANTQSWMLAFVNIARE